MPHRKNFLLNRLSSDVLDRISSGLVVVPLMQGEVLAETHARIEKVYFPHTGVTAACNALHTVQARACKWLLRMHDLAGPDLPLTQEFLAQMMGVRRTSVTEVAGELQKAGMITYSRGRIRLLDLDMINQRACECEGDVRSHYRRIFHSNEVDA